MIPLSNIPSTTIISMLNSLYDQKALRPPSNPGGIDADIDRCLDELRKRSALTKGLVDPNRCPSPCDRHTSMSHPLLFNRVSIL
jgi:hypothetical protein